MISHETSVRRENEFLNHLHAHEYRGEGGNTRGGAQDPFHFLTFYDTASLSTGEMLEHGEATDPFRGVR